MIQAELPESTIILAIEADPIGLDTSPDALIKMRENGAGKAVLDAMGNVRPEEVVSLAIPEQRKNDRCVEISRGRGFMAVRSSAGRNTVVPLRYEKIADVTIPGMSAPKYRLVPESKLVPGEYVLILNNQFFDFGVDGN
jgi:hypothetical protein